MATTKIELPNGTVITIEGSVDEVQQIIAATTTQPATPVVPKKQQSTSRRKRVPSAATQTAAPTVDLANIVNKIKSSTDFDAISTQVLDSRNTLHRVLLPLYFMDDGNENSSGLTSGEISRITRDLGVPIAVANVSRCLSGDARGYVTGDRMRVKGQPVRYKLMRRGVQYFRAILDQGSGSASRALGISSREE